MPFSVREADLQRYSGDKSHWDEVYAGLIVPAVERAGLKCMREDEDSQSRLITDNIWRKIEASDIVLCDMSSSNPNVFLELGWALRSDKRFVLIKDDLTPFYFDLQQFYTLVLCHVEIIGYSLRSFTRASSVVNCQCALACLSFRRRFHAWTFLIRVAFAAIRPPRH
jgi:hypothetical protein